MQPDATASTSPQPETTRLRLPSAQPIVTYALLVILGVIFALTYYADLNAAPGTLNPVLEFGVMDTNTILLSGQLYRLFTAMFLHLSVAHIFFNAYALYSLGRGLEGLFGHVRFLLVYLVGGFVGSLASFIIGRGASAGASGAIFAIFAAELVFVYRHRELLGPAARSAIQQILVLVMINLGIGLLTTIPGSVVRIDNWGHIGGFIGGLIVTSAIGPTFVVQRSQFGTPEVVDSTPFSARWPMLVLLVVIEIAVMLGAYATLPRP